MCIRDRSQTHSDRVTDNTGLQNCQTVLQDISVTESIKEEADIFSDKMSCQHEKGKSEMHTRLKTRSVSDSPTFLPSPSPIVSSHRGLQHPTSILQRGTSSFSRFPQKTHLYRPTPKWDTFDRSGYRYPVGSAQLQRNRGQPPSDHFGSPTSPISSPLLAGTQTPSPSQITLCPWPLPLSTSFSSILVLLKVHPNINNSKT